MIELAIAAALALGAFVVLLLWSALHINQGESDD